MPYIDENRRRELDEDIKNMVLSIRKNLIDNPTNAQFTEYLGDINYCFSRVVAGIMDIPSYSKIAMITGVLENIKQEFYRRIAEKYEDDKIVTNGDITEYKRRS